MKDYRDTQTKSLPSKSSQSMAVNIYTKCVFYYSVKQICMSIQYIDIKEVTINSAGD